MRGPRPWSQSWGLPSRCSISRSRGADPGGAQQAAQGFAAYRDTLGFKEVLAHVLVVESRVAVAGQGQDLLSDRRGQPARAGPPASGVGHGRLTPLPVTSLEAFDVPRR